MCRGRKRTCTELGSDVTAWSKLAPLMPPEWFDVQVTAFAEAVRLAASGEAPAAHIQLDTVRGTDLQTWYIEHGQMLCSIL